MKKPIVSYDELPEDDFDLYDVDLFLLNKVGESNGYDTRMAHLSAVAVDGVPMQLVPLLAWSGLGATQDMAKVFEWMLREFLLGNLRGASRVGKSRISPLKDHRRGSSAAARSIGKTEYIEVPKGAFYAARVCSDADLLDTVLNMLERMQTTAGQQPMGRFGETVGNVRADAGVCIAHNHMSIVIL